MKNRRLPIDVTIDGKIYPINQKGDYEVILDIIEVLNDKELTEKERAWVVLNIFYDFNLPDDLNEAIKQMYNFINCGETEEAKPNKKRLMDWTKDFPLIVSPVNRVIGYDIRSVDYLHWWTFMSAYMEIGECTFQTVVGIRNKKQKNKKLDKWEEDFYNENRAKIDLGADFTKEEDEFLKNLLGE